MLQAGLNGQKRPQTADATTRRQNNMARTQTAQSLPWLQIGMDLDQKPVYLDADVYAKLSVIVTHYNRNNGGALSLADWMGAVIECRFDMMIEDGSGSDAL